MIYTKKWTISNRVAILKIKKYDRKVYIYKTLQEQMQTNRCVFVQIIYDVISIVVVVGLSVKDGKENCTRDVYMYFGVYMSVCVS